MTPSATKLANRVWTALFVAAGLVVGCFTLWRCAAGGGVDPAGTVFTLMLLAYAAWVWRRPLLAHP